MMQNKTCSICNISIEENYCSRCGQKISKTPTTIISLINDFMSNIFSLEKSGFATILKILSNPKPIVNNYYNGLKNYYSSPGKILLYGIAIVAIHTSFVDKKVMGLSLEAQNISAQYLFWLFLFPLLLFISYVTFIRIEKGLSKHIISMTYVGSSLFIALTILNDIVILIWSDKLGIWTFLLFILFVFIWNSRVFSSKNKYLFIALNTVIQAIIFISIVGLLIFATNHVNNE
jgi:hypothetical protein